jgi:hypothetical protein
VPGNSAFASASRRVAFEGGERPRYQRKTSGFLRFGSSIAPGAGFFGRVDLPKNIGFSQVPGLVEEQSATKFSRKAQVLSGWAQSPRP